MSADIDAMVANMNAALDAYEKDKDEAALTKAAEEFQAKAQEFQTKYANLDSSKFTEADQPRTEVVTLCGKHCESGDAVAIDRPIQHPDLDDIVCVFGTGAYCYTMSSSYNGQPRPAIVFVRDGEARVVTRRETYADLMARDV